MSIEANCGNCGRPVSISSHAGQSCPHCGAYWSYERWNKRYTGSASDNSDDEGAVGGLVVIAILVGLGLLGKALSDDSPDAGQKTPAKSASKSVTHSRAKRSLPRPKTRQGGLNDQAFVAWLGRLPHAERQAAVAIFSDRKGEFASVRDEALSKVFSDYNTWRGRRGAEPLPTKEKWRMRRILTRWACAQAAK